MKLEVAVDEADVGQVKAGQEATFTSMLSRTDVPRASARRPRRN